LAVDRAVIALESRKGKEIGRFLELGVFQQNWAVFHVKGKGKLEGNWAVSELGGFQNWAVSELGGFQQNWAVFTYIGRFSGIHPSR
jgi:hypothetical protein